MRLGQGVRTLFHYRYYFRWKLVLWGFAIVLLSSIISSWLGPVIAPHLAEYLDVTERGFFLQWFPSAATSILFVIIAAILMIATSQGMVKRILALSDAARAIASGDFSVRIDCSFDRHDELYRLAQDFNQMAIELQNNEYLRKDFISNVSHEIKTPLAIINGYAELLASGTPIPAEEQKGYLETMHRESSRLLNMSTNMLRISRVDRQPILQSHRLFRLDEQLRQTVIFLEPKWSQKDLQLELDLPSTLLAGDPDLLEQVWFNLLDNAIKFSHKGGSVAITIGVLPKMVIVYIRDNGCGMDEETQTHAFDQFFQGETSHNGEGNGLGLALVKRIVERHGGSIVIDSAPDFGTTVSVRLPRKK